MNGDQIITIVLRARDSLSAMLEKVGARLEAFKKSLNDSRLKNHDKDVDRQTHSYKRLSEAMQKAASSGGILVNALSLLAVAAGPIASLVAALGGALISLASSAGYAAAALGGGLIAAVGALIPAMGLLVGAMARVKKVMASVSEEEKLADQRGASRVQTQRQQVSATEGVVRAQEALRDSYRSLAEARRTAIRQIEDLARAERRAALASKAASLDYLDAQDSYSQSLSGTSLREAQRSKIGVQGARLNVGEAQSGAARARSDRQAYGQSVEASKDVTQALRAVRDATRSLRDAQYALSDAMNGTSTGANALAVNLAKLSKAEKQLRESMKSIKKDWETVGRSFTDPIILGFDYAVRRGQTLLRDSGVQDSFQSLGQAIGGSIKEFVSSVTDAQGLKILAQLAETGKTAFPIVAQSLANIAKYIGNIAAAGGPTLIILLKEFRDWSASLERGSREWSKLDSFFQKGITHLHSWIRLGGSIVNLFKALGKTSGDAGKGLVDSLTGQINKLTNWINENSETVKKWFGETAKATEGVAKALLQIFIILATSINFDQLQKIADLFSQVIAPAVGIASSVIGSLISLLLILSKIPLVGEIMKWSIALLLVAKTVGTVFGAFSGLRSVFDLVFGNEKAVSWLKKLSSGIMSLAARAIPALSAALSFLAANPIILIIAAVVAIIAALVYLEVKFHWIEKTISWFGDRIGEVVDFIKDHWRLLISIFLGPFGVIIAVVTKFWGNIKSAFWGGIHWIQDNFIGFFTSMPGKIFDAIKSLPGKIGSALKDFGKWIAEQMWEGIKNIPVVGDIIGFFTGSGGSGGDSTPAGLAAGAAGGAAIIQTPVRRASGGYIYGNEKGGDSVHAMLAPGEVVLNRRQQDMIGHGAIDGVLAATGAPRDPSSRDRQSGREAYAAGGPAVSPSHAKNAQELKNMLLASTTVGADYSRGILDRDLQTIGSWSRAGRITTAESSSLRRYVWSKYRTDAGAGPSRGSAAGQLRSILIANKVSNSAYQSGELRRDLQVINSWFGSRRISTQDRDALVKWVSEKYAIGHRNPAPAGGGAGAPTAGAGGGGGAGGGATTTPAIGGAAGASTEEKRVPVEFPSYFKWLTGYELKDVNGDKSNIPAGRKARLRKFVNTARRFWEMGEEGSFKTVKVALDSAVEGDGSGGNSTPEVQAALAFAQQHVGDTYSNAQRLGPNSWDCSGFAGSLARKAGANVGVGGDTVALWNQSSPARGNEAVVFGFRTNGNSPINGGMDEHMGIRILGKWFDAGSGGVESNQSDSSWEWLRVPKGMAGVIASTPRSSGATGGDGTDPNSGWKRITASRWTDYGQNTSAGVIMGPEVVAWGETSNNNGAAMDFAAMGDLPLGEVIRVKYKGKTLDIPKIDRGRGGPGLRGVKRGLDLSGKAAAILGATGLDIVQWLDTGRYVTKVAGQKLVGAGKRWNGGRRADGGVIEGPQGAGDVVPVLLSPGEVVLNKHQQDLVGRNRIGNALKLTGAPSQILPGRGYASGVGSVPSSPGSTEPDPGAAFTRKPLESIGEWASRTINWITDNFISAADTIFRDLVGKKGARPGQAIKSLNTAVDSAMKAFDSAYELFVSRNEDMVKSLTRFFTDSEDQARQRVATAGVGVDNALSEVDMAQVGEDKARSNESTTAANRAKLIQRRNSLIALRKKAPKRRRAGLTSEITDLTGAIDENDVALGIARNRVDAAAARRGEATARALQARDEYRQAISERIAVQTTSATERSVERVTGQSGRGITTDILRSRAARTGSAADKAAAEQVAADAVAAEIGSTQSALNEANSRTGNRRDPALIAELQNRLATLNESASQIAADTMLRALSDVEAQIRKEERAMSRQRAATTRRERLRGGVDFAARRSDLQAEGTLLQDKGFRLQGQLQALTDAGLGESDAAKALREAIEDNSEAILDNTAAQQEINWDAFQASLSLIGQDVTSADLQYQIAQISGPGGTENISAMIAALVGKDGLLQQQRTAISGALATAIAEGAAPERIKDLQNQLLQNELATKQNTTQMNELTGKVDMAQSFSSRAWQEWRVGVFSGEGKIIPQAATGAVVQKTGLVNVHAGEVVIPSDRWKRLDAMLDSLDGRNGDVNVNITSPTEVADPHVMAKRIAFELRGSR